ncbi:hypothetical protein WR25_24900 [Diploscapter pachys]|uniref:Uncharacterized protein n=1 Tax=Diploscapter pachys TaxID=2018661 RepID=A0A2A2KSQ0_9BILA|nr:hypothetical protein WR25_24900 [Diploscapter pachys]
MVDDVPAEESRWALRSTYDARSTGPTRRIPASRQINFFVRKVCQISFLGAKSILLIDIISVFVELFKLLACLEIHICWKGERDARMEPPIQTEYLRSGGAMILIFIELNNKIHIFERS